MNAPDSPPLRVRGPADLLGAVPFLLGFHPQESLVIIGLDASKIVVTARVDLPDITGTPVLSQTLGAIKRGTAGSVVGAVFTATVTPNDSTIAERLRAEAAVVGLEVVDTLLVARGRWWSLGCPDGQCCPPDGTAMPSAPTVFDAAATFAGLVAFPNRDGLASMFTPLPGRLDLAGQLEHHHHEQFRAVLNGKQATYQRSVVIRALFAAQRAAEAGRMPIDEGVARFGVALQAYPVRDAVWLGVDGGRVHGIEVWVNLARRLPGPYDAAPLFLAAWAAYRDGNGALAGIAAELALESDPGYSAADLLLAVLGRGVDPRTLPKLRASSKSGDEPTSA